MYDVLIVGAGISGSLIAHKLSKYNLKILLLDKASDVCTGASAANSAMIHSGHDPKDNTLKLKYNLIGAKMYPDLCKELKVAYKQVGAFVVSTSLEENESLDVLINNCINRNIPYEVLSFEEARQLEPNLSDNVIKALSLPTTAIITPWEVVIAATEEAMLNGTELRLNYEVKKIEKRDNYFLINDEIQTKIIINAAGVNCDDITNMLRPSPYKVEARKGEYFILNKQPKPIVSRVIYPAPSIKGKGVLAVPTIHNNVMLGPNSDDLLDKEDVSTGEGLDYVKKQINKTIKNIPFNKLIHLFAGNRPHIDLKDFYIKEDEIIENFIHVAGIESPGLTSAPAIAEDISKIVINKLNPTLKDNYLRRKAFIKMNEMSNEEKNELIKEDPDFGRLVCKCEKVSLGEIKDVINRKCGATSLRAVRMRTRAMMGGCQGGFCEGEIVKALMKELNLNYKDVKLSSLDSNIFVSRDKEDL